MKKTLFGCVFAVTAVIGLVGCGGDDNSTKLFYDYSVVEGKMKDSRDGQVYKTVTIGTQTWMAENLNYAYTGVKYAYAGNISDSTSWCYNNDSTNCDKYGRLYTWSAAMDSAAHFSQNANTNCGYGYGTTCTPNTPHRGVCPEGWHVPNDDEWKTLRAAIGGTSTAGMALESIRDWTWSRMLGSTIILEHGGGKEKYGFSVLSAGSRNNEGDFKGVGALANFWSSSEVDSKKVNCWYFHNNLDNVNHISNIKSLGFSVRCLRDSK